MEISDREGIDPVDAMLKIIKESDGKALQLTYGYSGDDRSEALIEKMMAHELCLFETDTILRSSGFPNPASYGAFPRILGRYVREKKALSLADAISRMSGNAIAAISNWKRSFAAAASAMTWHWTKPNRRVMPVWDYNWPGQSRSNRDAGSSVCGMTS